jgi:hypothetical protein
METKKNLLTFKTFQQKRDKSNLQLPKWFSETIFVKVCKYINTHEKLHACKYLCDKSREMNTRNIYGLKWAKIEIVDEIERIAVQSNPIPESLLLGTGVSNDEIKRTLKPFMELTNQCLHRSTLYNDQIVYAYNNAQITMQDLRNIETLYNKLLK